ncbi:tRNA epoxyqueuosine(34) reductase QueG [Petrocella sp. FN5]|uniref:tRNA epoxyqueuosine(34) reductase QueG n=1 Tax=Petrocella sp. FN5 TaxID=3032002 RepID=UPI0023DCD20C|nr:tRNA epoxyqueuosine(34) reductase QueG [Petrocella sp. FN5]MDF1616352.1 tRNA epoxyqueuosine(34) reductase QueG [Petrocella sp. FN5]
MKAKVITENIMKFCDSIGIKAVGFAGAKPFNYLEDDYHYRQEHHLDCPFEVRDSLADLIDPKRIKADGKSFICILEPHQPYSRTKSSSGTGHMASGTASIDYHTILDEHLEKLQLFLEENYNIHGVKLCDTSPLSDRAIAVRAGLGVLRRNNMFYHKTMGSYVNIASLLIDYDLEARDYVMEAMPCGTCQICKVTCPTKAIIGDGTINSRRCISYMTQKKELSEAESKMIGRMIYGCDICQLRCPANNKVQNPSVELLVDKDVNLINLLNIDQATFNATYKKTASGWRGKRTLQRNAIAAIGNSGDAGMMDILKNYEHDDRSIIHSEVQRAIKRLENIEVK